MGQLDRLPEAGLRALEVRVRAREKQLPTNARQLSVEEAILTRLEHRQRAEERTCLLEPSRLQVGLGECRDAEPTADQRSGGLEAVDALQQLREPLVDRTLCRERPPPVNGSGS